MYMQTGHPLFADQPSPYKALCEVWASEGFQERSKKYRNVGTKNATHTLGGDGYRRMAQRIVRNRFMFRPSTIRKYMILTSTYRPLGLERSWVP